MAKACDEMDAIGAHAIHAERIDQDRDLGSRSGHAGDCRRHLVGSRCRHTVLLHPSSAAMDGASASKCPFLMSAINCWVLAEGSMPYSSSRIFHKVL